MKNYKHLVFLFFLFPFIVNAQASPPTRVCLSEQYQEQLNQSSKYQLQKSVRNFEKEYKNVVIRDNQGNCNEVVKLPIAIHYFNVDDSLQYCAIEAAKKQVDILNADFSGTNLDLELWEKSKENFPNIKIKSPCFSFEIASSNHPTQSGLKDGQLAIVFHNGEFENYNAYWNNYINLFIGKIPNGVLGYSPLGGWGNGDGVALGIDYIGTDTVECGNIGTDKHYNLGRTATHELGHYFLLDHIWGNGCGKDDGVTDTPHQKKSNGGCPGLVSSCGSLDLHMNYMDYTLDNCMYMFTAGQVDWMDEYVYSDLDNLIQNGRKVLNQSVEPPIYVDVEDVELDGLMVKKYTLQEAGRLYFRNKKAIGKLCKSDVLYLCDNLGVDISKRASKKHYAQLAWNAIQ